MKLPATELVSKHEAADQRERERERAVILIKDEKMIDSRDKER